MPKTDDLVYLDSSAIVKLIVTEEETVALRNFLSMYPQRISSWLSWVEVSRVVMNQGEPTRRQAVDILSGLSLMSISEDIVKLAAELEPVSLRSLDAIHLASALILRPVLAGVITYDRRMGLAAKELGFPVFELH